MFIPEEDVINNRLYLRIDTLHTTIENMYMRMKKKLPYEYEEQNEEWIKSDAEKMLHEAIMIYAEIKK